MTSHLAVSRLSILRLVAATKEHLVAALGYHLLECGARVQAVLADEVAQALGGSLHLCIFLHLVGHLGRCVEQREVARFDLVVILVLPADDALVFRPIVLVGAAEFPSVVVLVGVPAFCDNFWTHRSPSVPSQCGSALEAVVSAVAVAAHAVRFAVGHLRGHAALGVRERRKGRCRRPRTTWVPSSLHLANG